MLYSPLLFAVLLRKVVPAVSVVIPATSLLLETFRPLRAGTMRAPTSQTLREAAGAWLDGAREGSIRTRSGDLYKPSAVRTYDQALRLRVLPMFGARKLSEIRRSDLQDFVDVLIGEGHAASTIQMTFMPVRAIFRREVSRGRIMVNPTTGLELPAVRGGRERIADPTEAAMLLEALPVDDRALWATALYAGLRRGECVQGAKSLIGSACPPRPSARR